MGGVGVSVKLHFQLLALALIALASYGVAGYVSHNHAANPASAAKLPEIYFYDKLGRAVTLDSFKGKAVLVNLWASWCPPCVAELPSLARLRGKLPGEKFSVVAISMDRTSLKEIGGFLKARGAGNLDIYWDKDRQAPLKWKYAGLPTSFLLDRNGIILKQYNGGYEWDSGDLLKEIGSLLQ
jgi:thiol-disulfide isomerase/thioredoxin